MNSFYLGEFNKLAMELDKFHGVFSTLWRVGRPSFTDRIPTAGVMFDKTGRNVGFLFNPAFWESKDDYTKSFIICHEILHVILRHGLRGKDAEYTKLANLAMDIVVNHMLVSKFGFVRSKIQEADKICWIDTLFLNGKTSSGISVLPDMSFEYYYGLLIEKAKQMQRAGKGKPQGEKGQQDAGSGLDSLDDHSTLSDFDAEEVADILKQSLGNSLNGKEIDQLKQKLENDKPSLEDLKDVESNDKKINSEGRAAGTEAAGNLFIIPVEKVAFKKKWESVVKSWSRKKLAENDHEQWTKAHRRHSLLSTDLMLPTDNEDENKDFERILVYFFQDSSGSCWQYKERFFRAAKTLNPSKFDIRLFSFDTQVYKLDIKKTKIYGGGGTSFDIIENQIQKDLKSAVISAYPDAVFLITDGYGSRVLPDKPERWFWFLTEHNSRDYIHKKSKVFDLSKFE